jgi:hypothetical protein
MVILKIRDNAKYGYQKSNIQSSNPIHIYPNADIGIVGKIKLLDDEIPDNIKYVSVYTGKILDRRPHFGEFADDPDCPNRTWHGGYIKLSEIINENIAICHRNLCKKR